MKEIIKIRSEINEKEMKETIAKINKTKSWFLIGKRRDTGEFRTYCFDRIKSVSSSVYKFKFKKEQNAETSQFMEQYVK